MEYRKTSFLAEKAPETYEFLSGLKPVALIYVGILSVAFVLSLFFQWSVIELFIDCLMGWTLLSIPFVGVLIVSFDKEITIPKKEPWESELPKPKTYKYSRVWGVFLIIIGISALYCSNQYKKYYAFQCQTFYLEQAQGIYHLINDCEYIGVGSDDKSIDDSSLIKVKGVELLDTDYELCDACREWAEDAESDYEMNKYFKR